MPGDNEHEKYELAQRSLLEIEDDVKGNMNSIQWFKLLDESLKKQSIRKIKPSFRHLDKIAQQKAINQLKLLSQDTKYPFESAINLRQIYGNALKSREYKFNSFDTSKIAKQPKRGPFGSRLLGDRYRKQAMLKKQSSTPSEMKVDLLSSRMDCSKERKQNREERKSMRRREYSQSQNYNDPGKHRVEDLRQFSDVQFRLPRI